MLLSCWYNFNSGEYRYDWDQVTECGYLQALVALRGNAIPRYVVVRLLPQFGFRRQEEIPRRCIRSVRKCNSRGVTLAAQSLY
jgi:hypothetical protein